MFGQTPDTFADFVFSIYGFVNFAIATLVALALLYFFWGIAMFILHADNEEARNTGRMRMIWGIVGLFVIVSIWGILAVVNDTFL
jgi:hypothetical protein